MNPTAAASPAALDALHHWAPIVWLRVHPYAYPTLETIHIVGLALVFGSLWIVDLAILGLLRGLDVRQLARKVLPWTLAGFLLAAASGLTMFTTNVSDLIANPAFVLKMGLLFAAGTNAAVLHARGAIDAARGTTRLQAGLSILIWIAVIACGRWIAYV
ncbi:hypothetical protein O4H66_18565 [Comamonadaceae bacterium G21597-S1]|nr:hypothetical protein [Comamonadaceae bacterium G21597-S1]